MATRTSLRKAAILLTVAVTFVVAGGAARAEPPAGSTEKKSKLQTVIDDSLKWFSLTGGDELETPLKAVPVLRWDNNARGSASGLTAVYVGGGRSEAVVCVYPWEGRLVHEFSSLSRGRLVAAKDGVTFWHPEEPGVSFRAVPKADAPAESPAARLRQMKKLVRRFEATLVGWRRDDSDRQELRLLPRALYRYDKPTGEVIDGALFAFVMGTDPEVLLLIEAVQVKGEAQWQYAFARRTSGELQGRLDGQAVWSADRYPPTRDPKRVDRGVSTELAPLLD